MPETISLNARIGAITLAVFAPIHFLLSMHGPTLAPLAFASWLGVSVGILCLCEELGSAKPLNRAGLVLFGAAFCARALMAVTVDSPLHARAQLLFAFVMMGALLFWSMALMHRHQAPRTVGILGAAVTGSTLALILTAHLLVGSATIWGFSGLFTALSNPTLYPLGALTSINAILCLWGLVSSYLLWTQKLRSAP